MSIFIRCSDEYAPGQERAFKLEYKNQDDNLDENRPYLYNAWDAFNAKTLAITADLNIPLDYPVNDREHAADRYPDQTMNVFLYSNGQQMAQGKSQYQMTLDGYVYLGHTSEHRAWSGEIYGLRIYDRALSAEELEANAYADIVNYRTEGNNFAPSQEYDPALDANYKGFAPLPEGLRPDIIPFTAATDMIPLTGFYGSRNLFDYLYPMESDTPWDGAKLMLTEELETDVNGNTVSVVDFVIMYQSFCSRANLTPLAGSKTNYVVFKVIVEGEFEDFQLTAIGYDKASNDELEFPTGSTFGGIDPELDGQVQYLVYDVEDIFAECSMLTKFDMQLSGMTEDTTIYLLEMGLFETEEDAENYTQGILPELPSEDDQPSGDQPSGDQPSGDQPSGDKPSDDKNDNAGDKNDNADDKNDNADDGDTTTAKKDDATTAAPADEGGCASVVGFGAAAVLVAAAAAVVLKKKD